MSEKSLLESQIIHWPVTLSRPDSFWSKLKLVSNLIDGWLLGLAWWKMCDGARPGWDKVCHQPTAGPEPEPELAVYPIPSTSAACSPNNHEQNLSLSNTANVSDEACLLWTPMPWGWWLHCHTTSHVLSGLVRSVHCISTRQIRLEQKMLQWWHWESYHLASK